MRLRVGHANCFLFSLIWYHLTLLFASRSLEKEQFVLVIGLRAWKG